MYLSNQYNVKMCDDIVQIATISRQVALFVDLSEYFVHQSELFLIYINAYNYTLITQSLPWTISDWSMRSCRVQYVVLCSCSNHTHNKPLSNEIIIINNKLDGKK